MLSQRLACFVLAAAAVLTTADLARAEHVKNESAAFKFEVPTNWEKQQRGEVLAVAPRDGSVLVMIDGHPNQVMTERAAGFDTGVAAALVGRMLGEVRLVGGVEEVRHNGMPCIAWGGEGKNRDGRVAEFISLTCKTGDRKGVTIVGLASQGGVAAHRAAIRRVFEGLAPLKS